MNKRIIDLDAATELTGDESLLISGDRRVAIAQIIDKTIDQHLLDIPHTDFALKSELDTAIADLEIPDLSGLQSTVASQGTALGTLQDTVTGQGNTLTNLQGTVASQGTALGTLQDTVTGQGNTLTNLQNSVATLGSGSPATNAQMINNWTVSQSSVLNNHSSLQGSYSNLNDDSWSTGARTTDTTNQWIAFDFGQLVRLNTINYMKGRIPGVTFIDIHPHTLLQTSNDGTSWITVHLQIATTTQFTEGDWITQSLPTLTARHLRFFNPRSTGVGFSEIRFSFFE